jgi:acyl-CoA synthetase (AMP-forming)/AMP-acid ligase II
MPDYNLALLARAVAGAVPDRDYFVHGDLRLTYADMQDRARRFGRYLVDQGFEVHRERHELANHEIGQDTLGLYLHNGSEFLIANLGCFEARVVPFNVNYRYVAEELTYLLHDSGARGLVYHSAFAATLAEVLEGITGPRTLIQVPDATDNPLLPGAVWFDDALAASDTTPGRPDTDDIYIPYTGGTTGMPKGVLWRQADVYVSAPRWTQPKDRRRMAPTSRRLSEWRPRAEGRGSCHCRRSCTAPVNGRRSPACFPGHTIHTSTDVVETPRPDQHPRSVEPRGSHHASSSSATPRPAPL